MGAQAVSFGDRLQAKWHRQLARHLDRDLRPLTGSMPVISFTFDDAPQSAFERGGDIVRAEGGSGRSEERRVGKECGLLCRSRWSQYH